MIREFLMVLIASCSFIAASESFAQPQWETSLTFVQNPSGSIDQWRSDSTLGTLTINNPYPTPRRIVITYQLTNRANGLVVLRGRTPPKDIKAFPTQTTLKNPDFLDSIGFRHYGRDNSKTTWIRAVPEGQYLLCLTIEPSSHETLVPDLCSKIQIGAGIDTSEDVQRQGSGFLWAGKVNSMLGAGIVWDLMSQGGGTLDLTVIASNNVFQLTYAHMSGGKVVTFRSEAFFSYEETSYPENEQQIISLSYGRRLPGDLTITAGIGIASTIHSSAINGYYDDDSWFSSGDYHATLVQRESRYIAVPLTFKWYLRLLSWCGMEFHFQGVFSSERSWFNTGLIFAIGNFPE